MSWTTIESDPGVFTALVEQFGTTGVEFEELWSLDVLPPQSYGFIFLFKYTSAGTKSDDGEAVVHDPDVWFAKQTVQNACATQAILGVLLNSEGLSLGSTLEEFKSFTGGLPADMRGEAIGQSEQIRTAHNSFTVPNPFVSDEKKAAKDGDDVFHFIAYVPVNGKVYELDGLKSGPVLLGDAAGDWQDVAKGRIQARISRYAAAEIKFNVLSVIPSKLASLESALVATPDDAALKAQVEEEKEKRRRWDEENVRRKWNYVPFVVEMVKMLASPEMIEAGNKKREEKANLKLEK